MSDDKAFKALKALSDGVLTLRRSLQFVGLKKPTAIYVDAATGIKLKSLRPSHFVEVDLKAAQRQPDYCCTIAGIPFHMEKR